MKKLQAWVVLAVLFVTALSPAPVVQAQAIGEPVRVGLFYGTKALDEVRLSSAGGLTVGVLPATSLEVLPLVVAQGASDWRIRHEAIRLEFGPYDTVVGAQAAAAGLGGADLKFVISEGSRYYVRYGAFATLDVADRVLGLLPSPYKSSGSIIGLYRTASQLYATLEEARDLQTALLQAGRRVDLLYTGSGWMVLVGHGQSAAQAEQLGAELSSVMQGSRWGTLGPDQHRIEVYQHDGALQASFAEEAGDVYIGATNGTAGKPPLVTIHANGSSKQYRGFMQLELQANLQYQVNNYLTVDQYLMGVVPKELSWSHPLEALKAQAVAVRNYTEYNRGRHAGHGFDFCPEVHCQAYGDYSYEGAASQEAVLATSGMVLKYAGAIIPTYYHSDAGGHTEDVENVWVTPTPYLKGVPELYPSGSPHENWQVVLSQAEMQNLVAQHEKSVGTIINVEVLSVTAAGRVMKLRVTGTLGSVDFDKEETRLRDSSYSYIYRVKSRLYTVKPQIPEVTVMAADGKIVSLNPHGLTAQSSSGTGFLQRTDKYNLLGANYANRQSSAQPQGFIFSGRGYGHGIGMSQWGASAMAKNGHTFEEILKHYYRGVTIEKVGK